MRFVGRSILPPSGPIFFLMQSSQGSGTGVLVVAQRAQQ
jgi:hypothetical protein